MLYLFQNVENEFAISRSLRQTRQLVFKLPTSKSETRSLITEGCN